MGKRKLSNESGNTANPMKNQKSTNSNEMTQPLKKKQKLSQTKQNISKAKTNELKNTKTEVDVKTNNAQSKLNVKKTQEHKVKGHETTPGQPKKGRKRKKSRKSKNDEVKPATDPETNTETHTEEKITLPKTYQDVSKNWKQLQKNLNIGKKKSAKKGKITTAKSKTPENVSKEKPEARPEPEIWFDDVDEILIESSRNKIRDTTTTQPQDWDQATNPLVKQDSFSGITKIVAMDCEMVGVGADGEDSVLARVSVVNQYGQAVYDKLVRPREEVTDYRTQYSGIRPGDLNNADDFMLVQKEVSDIISNRILVGHAIHNDLKVLYLDHPKKQIRDTQRYKPFRQLFQGRNPSLKKLSEQVLGVQVQEGEHNSIQDAQAAMRLYTMYRKRWEKDLKLRRTVNTLRRARKKAARQGDDGGPTLDSDSDN